MLVTHGGHAPAVLGGLVLWSPHDGGGDLQDAEVALWGGSAPDRHRVERVVASGGWKLSCTHTPPALADS